MSDNLQAATPGSQEAAAGSITPMSAQSGAELLAKRRQDQQQNTAESEGKGDKTAKKPADDVSQDKAKKKSEPDPEDDDQEEGSHAPADNADDTAGDTQDDEDDQSDSDSDDSDGNHETDGEDDDKPETIRLKANGKEHDVTYDDLVRAWEKGQGVEKQIQDLSAKQKQVENFENKLKAHHAQAVQEIGSLGRELLQQLKQDTRYSQEEMARIRVEDPAEFAARNIELQQKMQLVDRARAVTEQRARQLTEQQNKQFEDFAKGEAQKLKQHWKDASDDERDARVTKIGQYLVQNYGFDQKEIDEVVRADMWIIAEKAMKYDQSRGNARDLTKQIRTAPKMLKPGVKGAEKSALSKAESVFAKAKAEHNKVGSSKTGAALLAAQRNLSALKSKRKG